MGKRIFVLIIIVVLVFAGISLTAQEKEAKKVSKKVVSLMKKVDKAIGAKEFDKALELCQKAIEIDQAYALPHYKKGLALKEQKKYSEAAGSLEQALQLQALYPEAVNAMVEVLNILAQDMMTQKDLQKANELYLKIVGYTAAGEAAKRLQTEALYQIGINFYALKKPELSNENFIKFIKTPGVETAYKGNFIIANYIVGVNYYQLKRNRESNEYLLKFLELSAANEANKKWVPLAHFLIGSNGFELLQKEVDKKEKTDIEGVAKLAKEDKLVAANLTKALELGLNLEQIYLTLGNYYYYCRDLDNAIKYYKLLIEKFPTSPDISQYNDFLQQLEKDKEK